MKTPILQLNKQITIKPGITVLGGASGAGKSTLYKLLRHGDDLLEGSISIGKMNEGKFEGVALTNTTKEEANAAIGFCFPEITDEGKTAYEMIRMYNSDPNLTDENIETAFRYLNLEIYTEIEKNGQKQKQPKVFREFSTGEKTRISFMQSFFSPKQILVFDEPTRGIDKATIKKMLQMLNLDAQKGRTILYTSHQLEELKDLDSVNGIIDLAPLTGEERKEFKKEYPTERVPSTLTEYPFETEEEKQAYIDLCENRYRDEVRQQRDQRTKEYLEKLEQHKKPEQTVFLRQMCIIDQLIKDEWENVSKKKQETPHETDEAKQKSSQPAKSGASKGPVFFGSSSISGSR